LLGVWSGATDLYDYEMDVRFEPTGASGYAGTYHVKGEDDWEGATGFYSSDIRAGLATDEGKTFAPIYVWADAANAGSVMYFSMEPGGLAVPPAEWQYALQLLAVPAGVSGAPPVGKTWPLTAESFTLELPAWATNDGLTGYQFAFTITPAVPEPATLGLLAAVLLLGRRRAHGSGPRS
jgi:hypothetical protein